MTNSKNPMKKDKHLLIDGDILAYRIAFSAEVATEWGDGTWTYQADEKQATMKLDEEINRLTKRLDATGVSVFLSDKMNFRKEVLPTYKANRTQRKPLLLGALYEYLRKSWKAVALPKLEADDLLGIHATNPLFKPECTKIIVSIDKDMRGIPCNWFNQDKDDQGVLCITEAEADSFHFRLTLTGDSGDGFSGCPKIGKVKAEKLLCQLLDNSARWGAVVKQFLKAGLTEEDAIIQARLARVLRDGDYVYATNEIKLWHPKNL